MKTKFRNFVNLVGAEASEIYRQEMIEKRRKEQAKIILEQLRRKSQSQLNEYFLSLVRNKRT